MEEWRAVRNSFFGVWFKKLEGVKDKDDKLLIFSL